MLEVVVVVLEVRSLLVVRADVVVLDVVVVVSAVVVAALGWHAMMVHTSLHANK